MVVLTDLEVPPMPPPKVLELNEEELNPLPLKKSSLSKAEPKPPKPPNPPKLPPFPFFLRPKKSFKKPSSSLSDPLAEKNLAKMSSAWLKSK